MLQQLTKKCIYILLLTCPLIIFAGQASASVSLQARLNALKTYQANFKQTTVANHRVTGTTQGHIWIQRPWHLRWVVTKPNKQMLIVNGHTVWNYNPDLMQATKQLLNDQQRQNAAMLLASDGSIANAFNIMQSDKSGITQYQLTPKKPSVVTKIVLNFSRVGLVSMQTMNHLGQTNYYQFSHIIVNHPISSSVFQFTPPKGVDVLEAGHAYGAH
jgi:outer membrane lipoprotein carrier protein